MIFKNGVDDHRAVKSETLRLKEERSLKKISKNSKKKSSIDEVINYDLNQFRSKSRCSVTSTRSRIKSKITSKNPQHSQGNTSKKKFCKQSENKIYIKLGVKKKDNMIKPDRKIITNLNSNKISSRAENTVNYFNSRIQPNALIKKFSSSLNRNESSLMNIHKTNHKMQKNYGTFKSFQGTQQFKHKVILKRVRFADFHDKSKKYLSRSHSMSSIINSETEEWVNPKLSPPSLQVSDFVKEFGQKISGKITIYQSGGKKILASSQT